MVVVTIADEGAVLELEGCAAVNGGAGAAVDVVDGVADIEGSGVSSDVASDDGNGVGSGGKV